MKKILIIIFLITFSALGNHAVSQLLGKWVLPIVLDGTHTHKTLLLTFYSDEIESSYIDFIPEAAGLSFCEIAAGGYDPNYELSIHVLGQTLYHQGSSYPWNFVCSQTINEFHPEYQIINRPGYTDRYYSFYSGRDLDDAIRDKFVYNEIWFQNDIPQFSCHNYLLGGIQQDNYFAFAITEEVDLERTLFATSITNGTDPAALYQWTITQNGVINKTEIINANNSDFEEDDFSSYNLEVKTDQTNDDVILAWITKKELTNDKVFVVIDGNEDDYDLNLGNIAGIEFSLYEDNVLYVSCPDTGIVKLDYNTGIVSTALSGSQNYGHSFIQTAPDGHIYAVADDGTNLGQINQGNGLFYPAYFTIPDDYYIFSTYRIIDNAKYFILPENDRTYDPLLVSVTVENETCPGYPDGTATICVTGGTPGIYPDPEYNILCIGPQGNEVTSYYYDPITGCFYFTGLSAGLYSFHITDGIGTYYDGTFTVEPYNYDLGYIEINNSMTWDDIYPLHSTIDIGIRVKSNATLTINDAILEFGPDGKVEIEAGAKIVSNNTVFRNLDCDPQQKWKGIEVWGNKDSSQYATTGGNSPQGVIELNSSTVMNAENGVAVWALENNYWWTSGGIVKAINTMFKNNTKSIHFIPYVNTFPPTGQPCNNLSYFKSCTFMLDNEYITNTMFWKHVDLHGVKGIKFLGCNFVLATSNGVSQWNNGIASYGSGFKVDEVCNQPVVPCPSATPSSYNGFYRGISAHGSGIETPAFQVWNATFTNNVIGIYDNMVPYAVIVGNNFEIGYNGTTDNLDCSDVAGSGIEIYSALGYAIENNNFTKLPGAPQGNYVGVRLNNTKSEADDVYNNEFNGLSVGNLAEGLNRSELHNDHTGVEYLCNTNSFNYNDFHVADNSRIKGTMGSDELPSGNTLSQPSQGVELQFLNEYTQEINYYWYDGDPWQELTLYSDYVSEFPVSVENTCPDHYGGGGTGINVVLSTTEKTAKEQEYNLNMADYTITLDLINTLKDGGDTPLMEHEIETAWPDEMWVLRTDLLANSPHLSFEVLKDVADRTDVFPESVQFEIFAANPDEMNYDFLTYLESKTQPMPQYMVDMLRQVGYGSSYKTVLKNQLATYWGNAVQAAQDIIRSELLDSIPDINEVRLWLGNIGGYQADKQIIAAYLQEGDIANAQSLLAQLPTTYALSGDDLLAYNDYNTMMQLQINLMQQGRTIFDLDGGELATVNLLAAQGYGSAKKHAQSILEYAYGQHFYDCPDLPEGITLKQLLLVSFNSNQDVINICIKPNPADTWLAIDYSLPYSADEGMMFIVDVTGKTIESIKLSLNKGQKVVDTRKIPAGVYICKIESLGYSNSKKLVIL